MQKSRARSTTVDWRALAAESSAAVTFENGLDGRVRWASETVRTILGVEPDELVGHDFISFLHPDDAKLILGLRQQARGGQALDDVRVRVQVDEGGYREMEGRVRPLHDTASGEVIGYLVELSVLHGRIAVARAFATLVEGNRVMLRAHTEAELLQQMCETIAKVAGYAFLWYGLRVDDADKSVAIVAHGGNDMGYLDQLQVRWDDSPLGSGPTGMAIRTREPQVRVNVAEDPRFAPWFDAAAERGIRCSIALPVIVHGEVHGALMAYAMEVGTFDEQAQDLLINLAADLGYGIERLRESAALEHELSYDSLTGLATKRVALERISDVLHTRRAPGWALLCVGVDGMTAINQAFTYAAGDEVLRVVAQRLVAAAGAHDRVGRITGDEFVVMLRDVVTADDAAEAAQRILRTVPGIVEFGEAHLDVNVSVGVAMATSRDAEALLRDASAAMRIGSRKGPGKWAFLDQNVEASSRHTLAVQAALREALGTGSIISWYMPVVDLAQRSVRGYEALVRWVREDGRVATPDEFLPIAERSNIIIELDRTMLMHNLEVLSSLDESLHLAINVSGPTLQSGMLTDWLLPELKRRQLRPGRLHLEVTETALFNAGPQLIEDMKTLSEAGIVWWIDDFGTGYSSISLLRDLPVHGLKLDRSFTERIETDTRAKALARGVGALANGLDLLTIAEGVETEVQAQLLCNKGWRLGQGWLFGKAAPLPQ